MSFAIEESRQKILQWGLVLDVLYVEAKIVTAVLQQGKVFNGFLFFSCVSYWRMKVLKARVN